MNRNELHKLIGETQPNICQLVAMKNGEVAYSDQWHEYTQGDCLHIMSATKSIAAILVGIAIDQGLIKSVDDRVLSFFPDYKVKRGEKTIFDVTIRHLLTMRAPYKCKGDPWTKVCTSDNWTYASLDFLGGRKGMTDEFRYQTVCLHILTGILNRVTGMTTVEFANRFLFEPLGILRHSNYYAESAEEHKHFILDKSPKEAVWFADPLGIATPGYGLCMSATDLAKIGLMCLNGGIYEGQRIVSSAWIEEMTKPRKVEDGNFRGMDYGYLWWIVHPEEGIYAAIGNSGNVIYVNPRRNIVVGITAYFNPRIFDRVDFIEEELLEKLGLA